MHAPNEGLWRARCHNGRKPFWSAGGGSYPQALSVDVLTRDKGPRFEFHPFSPGTFLLWSPLFFSVPEDGQCLGT